MKIDLKDIKKLGLKKDHNYILAFRRDVVSQSDLSLFEDFITKSFERKDIVCLYLEDLEGVKVIEIPKKK